MTVLMCAAFEPVRLSISVAKKASDLVGILSLPAHGRLL